MSLVSMRPFDTDQRQVPVRLCRPIMFRHLEHRADIPLHIFGQAVCNDRFNRCVIALHARGKPNRDPGSVGEAMRRSHFKRIRSKGAE